MSDLIESMETEEIIVCRRTGRYVNGRYKTIKGKELKITVASQPATRDQILRLPEGRRTTESRGFFSDDRLFATDEKTGSKADLVHAKGKVWEIHEVGDWTDTDLPHYHSIGVKVDGQGAGKS